MKTILLVIALACFMGLLALSSCEVKEVQCEEFDQENLILTLSMFQKPHNELYFISQSDTLTLKKSHYGFSESYVERCGSYPDPYCDCYGAFTGAYTLNDSIFLRTQLLITTPEEGTGTVQVDMDVSRFHYGTFRIYNSIDSIQNFIDHRIVETLTINEFQFQNALDINITNDEAIERIIK